MQSMIEKNLDNYLINICFRFSIFTQINLYPLSLGWSKASDCSLNLEIIFSLASYWSLVLSGSAYKGGICLSCIRLYFYKGKGHKALWIFSATRTTYNYCHFLVCFAKVLVHCCTCPCFFFFPMNFLYWWYSSLDTMFKSWLEQPRPFNHLFGVTLSLPACHETTYH